MFEFPSYIAWTGILINVRLCCARVYALFTAQVTLSRIPSHYSVHIVQQYGFLCLHVTPYLLTLQMSFYVYFTLCLKKVSSLAMVHDHTWAVSIYDEVQMIRMIR